VVYFSAVENEAQIFPLWVIFITHFADDAFEFGNTFKEASTLVLGIGPLTWIIDLVNAQTRLIKHIIRCE